MIHRILNILGLGDGSLLGASEWRRKYVRHEVQQAGIQAEVEIGGKSYKIRDWSLGGICFDIPTDAPVPVGQDVEMNIRFRLPHETITIQQVGRIIRAVKRGIATEFKPLAPEMRRGFEKVLDGMHTQRFLESQVA